MNYPLYSMLLVAYLLGSLSFAIIVSKFMKIDDPRSYGSQNAGATNVMRSGNKKAAALTLIGDLLKGLLVVLIVRFLMRGIDGGEAIVGICGVLAVIGHIYPIFFKFKGGKGVATAIGVLLGFSPLLALLLVITWIVVFKTTKISSLAAILATLLSPLYAYILMGNASYFGATTIIAFFVIYKHKENIVRLVKGQEHSFKKKSEVAKPSEANTTDASVTEPNAAMPQSAKFTEADINPALDLYQLLGLVAAAQQDEIAIAYHQLLQNSLPEDEAYAGTSDEKHSVNQLQLIEYAYAILSNPKLRQTYDNLRKLNPSLAEEDAND